MSHKQTITILAVTLFCATSTVRAEDGDKPTFSVAGYGTLGLTHSNEGNADFVSNYLQPNGAGYTRSWSASVDSKLGLQVTGNFNPSWSAIVQVISQQRYDDSYTPTVEWANIKYQITPDLNVRLGRIAMPNFLTADYRNVGYAIPWVRSPGEVYNLVPITNSDGVDAHYRLHFGDVIDTVQVVFGKSHISTPGSNHVDVHAMHGLTNSLEFGATTVRMTYLRANLDIDIAEQLFSAFQQFGPQGAAIAAKYSGEDKETIYSGIGINYDPGDWFLMAELGNTRTHSFLGEKTAGYVSAGYHYQKFTPYLTLAQVDANSNRSDPGLPTTGLPPALAGEVAGLNGGLNSLLGSIAVQKSLSLGLRWDFMKGAALKSQIDFIHLGNGSPGDFSNTQPSFIGGGKSEVVSIAVDFVF